MQKENTGLLSFRFVEEQQELYTTCRPIEITHEMLQFELPEPPSGRWEADEDIVAGRVATFGSVDEMLRSLKSDAG